MRDWSYHEEAVWHFVSHLFQTFTWSTVTARTHTQCSKYKTLQWSATDLLNEACDAVSSWGANEKWISAYSMYEKGWHVQNQYSFFRHSYQKDADLTAQSRSHRLTTVEQFCLNSRDNIDKNQMLRYSYSWQKAVILFRCCNSHSDDAKFSTCELKPSGGRPDWIVACRVEKEKEMVGFLYWLHFGHFVHVHRFCSIIWFPHLKLFPHTFILHPVISIIISPEVERLVSG